MTSIKQPRADHEPTHRRLMKIVAGIELRGMFRLLKPVIDCRPHDFVSDQVVIKISIRVPDRGHVGRVWPWSSKEIVNTNYYGYKSLAQAKTASIIAAIETQISYLVDHEAKEGLWYCGKLFRDPHAQDAQMTKLPAESVNVAAGDLAVARRRGPNAVQRFNRWWLGPIGQSRVPRWWLLVPAWNALVIVTALFVWSVDNSDHASEAIKRFLFGEDDQQ